MVDVLRGVLYSTAIKADVSQPSLDKLKETFFGIAGTKLEKLKQADFLALRAAYPSAGNVINYVAGLLEIYTNYYGDFEKRESGLREDLRTAIVEHALADAVGEYTFTNQWVVSDRGLRLNTSCGFLDEIINRSINNQTGQIPQFEIERNKMDKRVFEILTERRNSGSKETVVKFSPSPVNIHDPEVRARGYQGNDQICLFELTEGNQEKQTIYWFPRAMRGEYLQLAKQLIDSDPYHASSDNLVKLLQNPHSQKLDLEVMAYSNSFSPQQIEIIRTFIYQNQQRLEINRLAIENYANSTIKNFVDTSLILQVYRAAIALLQGENREDLNQELKEIFTMIEQAQFDFRLYNRDYGRIDTLASSNAHIRWDDFQQLTAADRYHVQRASGFQASGCGFGTDQSSKPIWGPRGIVINFLNRSLYVYECPKCHTEHDIDVPNKVLVDECKNPSCKNPARCKSF